MPLNSIPPTTTPAALETKRRSARSAMLSSDVGFWGGIIPGNLGEVVGLAAAGVRGFKCFLVASGVDEFPAIGFDDLDAALTATAAVGLPLLVHAESPAVIAAAPAPRCRLSVIPGEPPAGSRGRRDRRSDRGDAPYRWPIPHPASLRRRCPPLIAAAKSTGVSITAETCPHYLALTAEEIGDHDLAFKCAPPIRDAANRDRLWDGLAAGTIDMVVSDHSPCPGDLKQGGFAEAWGGIASLELRLPVMWTEAQRRGLGIGDLARWLCAAPAKLAALETGEIAPGLRADLVVWNPDATIVVDPAGLAQRHPITPYAGRSLRGRVETTIVRGGSTPTLLPEMP